MKKIKVLLILINIFLCSYSYAQSIFIDSVAPSSRITDSLSAIYGQNKYFIKDIEKAALVALSYFPDLKEVSIYFELRKIRTNMAAKPKLRSITKSGFKRKYLICINHQKNCMGIEFFNKLPFDAQVGVIAHELCHIQDYTQRNFWGISGFGIAYLLPSKRRKIENRTDETVIEHGLGNALSTYCYQLEHDNCLPKKYIQYKKKYYYNYIDIKRLTYSWESSHSKN